ncbi:MAG: tetratricopeptide repeat protein [bacterium]|nr:tetratricopeptide repeat protein [bacterium]
MKNYRFIAFLSILLLFSISVFGDVSSEELFNSGKELFEEYKYSEAIGVFERVVNEFPEYVFVPKAYFEIGMCYYYKWDVIELKGEDREKVIFDKAIENFRKVISGYPGSDIADDAQKWLGDCYYFGASVYGSDFYTEAIEEYKKVITDYNESALCAVSQFQIGKCCFNLKNYSQAKIEFDKVIENYPDSKYVQQAEFYLEKIK